MGISQTPRALVPAEFATGMTLLASISLASVTNFTNIPQTYKDLKLIVRNFRPTTDNRTYTMRFNSDTSTNYFQSLNQTDNEAANSFNNSYHPFLNADNTVTNGIDCVDIIDYANTSTYKMSIFYSVATNPTTTTQFGVKKGVFIYGGNTSGISRIDLEGLASSIAGGTALLYGVS